MIACSAVIYNDEVKQHSAPGMEIYDYRLQHGAHVDTAQYMRHMAQCVKT